MERNFQMRIHLNRVALAGLTLLSFFATAHAGSVVYTLTGTGAGGFFNGTAFTNQNFTITGTANNATVATLSGFPAVLLNTTTIQIGANPLATVLVSPYYIFNLGAFMPNLLAFSDATTNIGINSFQVLSGGTAWNLTSNFGPGVNSFSNSSGTSTNLGVLNINYSTATFTAVAGTSSSTPEPGSFGLAAFAVSGLLAVRLRRRKLVVRE